MNFDPQMKTTSNKVRHIITLTTGQYDHLYNIMCSKKRFLTILMRVMTLTHRHLTTYLILGDLHQTKKRLIQGILPLENNYIN